MSVDITLSPWDIMLAAQAGVQRQVENLSLGRKHAYGLLSNENDWQYSIEGCLGEFALAKFLGVNWPGKNRIGAADVGDVDVRTSAHEHGALLLHPPDPDDRPFWLLTGLNGNYVVHGWIHARDGKLPEYWRDPTGNRPAFFVPQSKLNPAESFEGSYLK